MRHTLQVLAALVLAAIIAVPAVAATPGGAARESLTGILETAYIELGDGQDHLVYSIRNAGGITPVEFERGDPRSISGSRVTVTGTRQGNALRVRSAEPGPDLVVRRQRPAADSGGAWAAEVDGSGTLSGGVATEGTVAETVVNKSIAVVLFNFTNLTTKPFTKTQVRNALLDSSTSAKRFFEEESKGRMTVSGAVFGWYTIDSATTGCNWTSWRTLAWDAANAAGANLDSYTNVMFVFPNTSDCYWAGLGYVPGNTTLLNGNISVQVMTHELGHNFGLGHSSAANCLVGGTRVMIAATADCATVGYADPFSTMGNNALRHDHGSHLGELGWLTSSEKVIAVPGNTYTITPYFGGDGLKLVRVPRGDGSFFDLDTRMRYGAFDTFTAGSPVTVGTSIRIGRGTASPTWSPKETLLLDSVPSTSTLNDAPLAEGKTMTDPVSKLSITTLSADSSGVVVRVRDGYAPSKPGNLAGTTTGGGVALTWTASTDDTAVTGYRVTRDGSLLTTTGGSATGWTDAGSPGGATYTYGVTAVDVAIAVPAGGPAPTPSPTASPPPTPDPSGTPDPSAIPEPTASPGSSGSDAQAPTPPDLVTGEPTTTSVALTWTPATDDTGVVGYRVIRNGSLVASPTNVTWKDTARAPETTYHYSVAALDGVGNVSEATSIVVTTLPDTTGPTKPKNFHKVRRSGAYVKFNWAPSTDDVGVVRYYVYRTGRAKPVASTKVSKIRIRTVRGARYYVRAVDAAGNLSEKSAKVRGRR
jgi:hypothetical protein